MAVQTIVTPSDERLIVLAKAAYTAFLEAAEDGADRVAVATFRRRFDAGDEEFVPGAMVDRLLAGESPIRVWREHRGLEAEALAQRADITLSELSQIEAGTREGTVGTYRKIAEAPGVDLGNLVA